MKEKIKLIEEKIKNDLNNLDEERIELFFDSFKNYENGKYMGFIEWYNKIVLCKGYKKRINFCEFDNGRHWATNLGRFDRRLLEYFQENQRRLISEIKRRKDITEFYKKYCEKDCLEEKGQRFPKRNNVSFCSKLFHTVLPNKYPPIDGHIRKAFKKSRLPFDITSVLIVKKAYENSIKDKDNKDKLDIIKKVLSKKKFSEFRVKKLSDMRIFDMFYWYSENMKKTEKKKVLGIVKLI